MILSKIEVQAETAVITRTLTVCEDFSWFASAFSQKLPRATLTGFPDRMLTLASLQEVVNFLGSCSLCVGNPDDKYKCLIEVRKGLFMDPAGSYALCSHNRYTLNVHATIR